MPRMPSHDLELSEAPNDDDIDVPEMAFSHRGCCYWISGCYSKRGSSVGSIWWERIRTVEYKTTEPWWTRGWKKIREWSELIAGPKWKTFIRTFRKSRTGLLICGRGGGGAKQQKFQYDPLSYALNFDDGPGQNSHYMDEDLVARDFSSRFAAVPACSKSCAADVGKDAPLIT
ncbi:NHL domain protein [Melia azedarach]|uniref:NHL domain protein n=1 Tax=Melia azedarach TaxID=155640 RepID=A0ACC1Z0C7_MELAZ|nr:NHL domain protein [Melia azedarach]